MIATKFAVAHYLVLYLSFRRVPPPAHVGDSCLVIHRAGYVEAEHDVQVTYAALRFCFNRQRYVFGPHRNQQKSDEDRILSAPPWIFPFGVADVYLVMCLRIDKRILSFTCPTAGEFS